MQYRTGLGPPTAYGDDLQIVITRMYQLHLAAVAADRRHVRSVRPIQLHAAVVRNALGLPMLRRFMMTFIRRRLTSLAPPGELLTMLSAVRAESSIP